jgi:hypothetical protein
MRPIHGRVHGYFPIDLSGLIRLGQKPGMNAVPGAIAAEPSVAFPDRLPRPINLWQITPRNPRPEPVNDALHHAAMVLKRPAGTTRRRRHQRLDPSPLTVRQHGGTRHGPSLPNTATRLWETRPSPGPARPGLTLSAPSASCPEPAATFEFPSLNVTAPVARVFAPSNRVTAPAETLPVPSASAVDPDSSEPVPTAREEAPAARVCLPSVSEPAPIAMRVREPVR